MSADTLATAGRHALPLALALAAPSLTLAAPALAGPKAGTTVKVSAGSPSEFAFKLSKTRIPAGRVTFEVKNAGTVAHDFKVCTSPKGGLANTCAGKGTKLI